MRPKTKLNPVILEEATPDVVLLASDDLNSMIGVTRDISSREPDLPIAVLYGGSPDNGFVGAAARDIISRRSSSRSS